MQIKIEDFEKCLECWKTLYQLDDEIYKIILGELQNPYLTPTKTYAYIIGFENTERSGVIGIGY
jgi:hypothetical protein